MTIQNLRFASAIIVLVCCLAASPVLSGEIKGTAFGEPLTGSEITAISDLLGSPDEYVGKTVRVEGTVDGVCEMAGCWISLETSADVDSLKIKAEDGVIVFPSASIGKSAVAEGVFTRIEMTLEQTIAHERHHAEETGEEFDEASVTEAAAYFQIDVLGAVIN